MMRVVSHKMLRVARRKTMREWTVHHMMMMAAVHHRMMAVAVVHRMNQKVYYRNLKVDHKNWMVIHRMSMVHAGSVVVLHIVNLREAYSISSMRMENRVVWDIIIYYIWK
jgi:hypothetical protein